MPRKSKGPRLYWYEAEQTWLIRDGGTSKRTGCARGEIEDAERKLAAYIAAKWKPDTSEHRQDHLSLATVIDVYQTVQLPKRPTRHRQRELLAQCARLNAWWGDKTVSTIRGDACRTYAAQSSTPTMARHDLEILRAAVNHYKREFGLDVVPSFTLPEKPQAREGHMTRSMAAKLVLAAWRLRQASPWGTTKRMTGRHLARFILIGLYTGTRSGAILDMQWLPNTTGGWFDLDRGVMHRAAEGARKTRKRKPPAVIPNKLLAHLKRWRRLDSIAGATIKHVVHWNGEAVSNIHNAWGTARTVAGLPQWVIPHILRHTAITWSMQAGKNVNVVSDFYGVSVKVLETTYWHHSPLYQKEMRT